MSDAFETTGRNSLGRGGTPALAVFRLAVAGVQAGALWWLNRSGGFSGLCSAVNESECGPGPTWPATVPEVYAPLAMIFVMVPALLLAGAGRMRPVTLAVWALVATAFLSLLGWHGVAAGSVGDYSPGSHPPFLVWPMPLFAGAALFIGHHLILPADLERKRIAAYPAYFDTAWKSGVQLALSIGFTGACWILLYLGSALFSVIGLRFLEDLLRQDWFAIPVTTVMFAVAVHLTDVRDGLIRGVRSVALMLLSWLLLLMTVLAAGFLIALPFTGLEGLWATGSATALVLSAAAALIVLINTAYQDGRPDNLPPIVLRIAVRVASALLTPLVAIAFWGLALRIGQHGLTPDRIIAAACALIGAAYAAGYGFAAIGPFWRKGAGWMQPLERTNILTAVGGVVVILALFSPLADPARLSVADQVARLERGDIRPDKFDYRFLRFSSGKAGQAALERLTRSRDPVVASSARNVLAIRNDRDGVEPDAPSRAPVYEVVPNGTSLPPDFDAASPARDSRIEVCRAAGDCVASAADLNGDGIAEVMIANSSVVQLWAREAQTGWRIVGSWGSPPCRLDAGPVDPRDAMRKGVIRPATPQWPDLAFEDRRSSLVRHPGCEPSGPAD